MSGPPPLKPNGSNGISTGFTFDLPESDRVEENLDPSEGEWVFKQDGVVLGPVAAAVLLERIDEGALSEATLIGRSAGDWVALKEVPYFYRAQRRANARLQRVEAMAAHKVALRNRRLIRVMTFAGLAAVPLLVGTVTGRTVMVNKPWDTGSAWVSEPPPLVDLQPKPKVVKEPDPPKKPEDEVKDPDQPKDTAVASEDKKEDRKRRRRRRSRSSDKDKGKKDKLAQNDVKKKDPPKDLVKKPPPTITDAQVTKGFKAGVGDYKRCIKTEFNRDKELNRINVRLEFTITEKGRAINARVRERQFRNGPLEACLVKAVGKLRWPRFTGERRNAVYPLRAKRPN